ncbi:MAG: DUF4162 domain-containing protein, partial [Alphaproteobacteria bacterium]
AEYCNRVALIDRGRLIDMASPVALRQRQLGGDLLLLECEQLGSVIAALQEAGGVRDVAAFGNSLHILVDDAAKEFEALPRFLAERGLNVSRIQRIEPTLEDVFVHLVGAKPALAGIRP